MYRRISTWLQAVWYGYFNLISNFRAQFTWLELSCFPIQVSNCPIPILSLTRDRIIIITHNWISKTEFNGSRQLLFSNFHFLSLGTDQSSCSCEVSQITDISNGTMVAVAAESSVICRICLMNSDCERLSQIQINAKLISSINFNRNHTPSPLQTSHTMLLQGNSRLRTSSVPWTLALAVWLITLWTLSYPISHRKSSQVTFFLRSSFKLRGNGKWEKWMWKSRERRLNSKNF